MTPASRHRRGRPPRESSVLAPELHALAGASPVPFWLDTPDAPEPTPALVGAVVADLAVVGGGYTGLWAALLAAEQGQDVVLVEARTCGWAASGRNGGFCSSSLTHGFRNGLDRFGDEMLTLERLGRENLDAIEATVDAYGIECSFTRSGDVTVATAPWQVDELRDEVDLAAAYGLRLRWLDADELRAEISSPVFLGGLLDKDGCALVDPARLAWGLRRACLQRGVRIYERTAVSGVERDGPVLALATSYGQVRARGVVLATNAFPPLLRRLRTYVVPVYDYALVTEPLPPDVLASLGWVNRRGFSDAGNQFHYFRLTDDGRLLWGGFDAVYHYGSAVRDELTQRPETFALLARNLHETFPAVAGVPFTHAWGGVIDTSTRFCAFFGTAFSGRLAYAMGYTGLGVGASRFGARVALDLLGDVPTELTTLGLVRRRPLPFPPEPLRWAGITLTRRAMARADVKDGRRNLWLRTLDRVGLGFDS